jgi:flagellar basal-body rod protein FlgF/flagellar basal-body rod protein FlgG
MLPGLYSASVGLNDGLHQQEVLAENLAHLSTPGFRTRGIRFQTVLEDHLAPEKTLHQVQGFVDFQPGPIRETGHALHFAIKGDGFFTLRGPQGLLYTRNGSFHRRVDGQIVSSGGYPLMGVGGPLTIPADAQQITVGRDGTVQADGVPVDQIRLTHFGDLQKLRPVGPTLFAAPADAREEPATATILQGALEGSNVNPAKTIVDMIQISRFYEAVQRTVKALGDALQWNTRPE